MDRKLYTAPPGKSYASITTTAGVTVSYVDAARQIDPVLTEAPQSSSYNAASTEISADSQRDTSEILDKKIKTQKEEKGSRKLK